MLYNTVWTINVYLYETRFSVFCWFNRTMAMRFAFFVLLSHCSLAKQITVGITFLFTRSMSNEKASVSFSSITEEGNAQDMKKQIRNRTKQPTESISSQTMLIEETGGEVYISQGKQSMRVSNVLILVCIYVVNKDAKTK